MQDTVSRGDAGLGKPARKRRGELGAVSGATNGVAESPGGKPEPVERIEDAPRSEPAASFQPIDPLTIPADAGSGSGDSGDADQPRRRGRKKGGHNRAKENQETVSNLEAFKLEDLLVTSCFFLGNLANAPELYATDDEALKVANAYREFAKYHTVALTDKRMSEINMTIVAAGFVGTRVVALWKKKPAKPRPTLVPPQPIREERAAAPAPAPVIDIPGGLQDPITGNGATPAQAKTPAQMWNQPGDIPEGEGE
jgi:hypothetical protein